MIYFYFYHLKSKNIKSLSLQIQISSNRLGITVYVSVLFLYRFMEYVCGYALNCLTGRDTTCNSYSVLTMLLAEIPHSSAYFFARENDGGH